MSRLVLVAAALLVTACARASQTTPLLLEEPCAGRVCRVSLYNHTPFNLIIRYADSTGRRELIGRAAGASTKIIPIQFVHSAGVRIFATYKGAFYATDYTFPRSGPMYVDFPDDFEAVADTLMPVRPARGEAGK